jgi:hypothetical protein
LTRRSTVGNQCQAQSGAGSATGREVPRWPPRPHAPNPNLSERLGTSIGSAFRERITRESERGGGYRSCLVYGGPRLLTSLRDAGRAKLDTHWSNAREVVVQSLAVVRTVSFASAQFEAVGSDLATAYQDQHVSTLLECKT